MPSYENIKYTTVLPWGFCDPKVTATQKYSEIEHSYIEMLDTLNSLFKNTKLSVPRNWRLAPFVMLPLGGRTAIEKRATIKDKPSSPKLLKAMRKAIKLLLLDKPQEEVILRRKSGVGRTGNPQLDKMAKFNREELFAGKEIFDFGLIDRNKLISQVAYRREPKAKKIKQVYTYTGAKAIWSHKPKLVFDDIGEFIFAPVPEDRAPFRKRPFYLHGYPNLLLACFIQLFDKSKHNDCTCPTLEVPVATTLTAALQKYYSPDNVCHFATGDVARMTTCFPGDCLHMIWDEISTKVAAWADVSTDSVRRWFDLFYPINEVVFQNDLTDPAGTEVESVRNVIVGNPDGVAGTTFNNDCLVLAWIILLFEEIGLPAFDTIEQLANHPLITFRWIGDTVLVASKTIDAKLLLTKLSKIIADNSIDGDFTIDDSEIDPWCGYCLALDKNGYPNGVVYSSEMSSLKIFVPEYESDDDHWRPNPKRGFEDALRKFSSIPNEHRLLKPEAVQVYQNFYKTLDLNFPDPKSPEADLELYFYHPSYINLPLPETYFLHISKDVIKKGLQNGNK